MSSYSTNFKSYDNAEGFHTSPERHPTLNESFRRPKSRDNYYTLRKMQQQQNSADIRRDYVNPLQSSGANNKYDEFMNNRKENNNNNMIPLTERSKEFPMKTPNFKSINNMKYINYPNNNTIDTNINYPSSSNYNNIQKVPDNYTNRTIVPKDQTNTLTYSYSEKNSEDIKKDPNNNINNSITNNKNSEPIKSPREIELENELLKANDIIAALKQENEDLLAQRDDALFHLSPLEKENEELRRKLEDSLVANDEKDAIIEELHRNLAELDDLLHQKDQEINDLQQKIREIQQEASNRIEDLNNKINDLLREKDDLYRDFQKELNDLNDKIKNLKKQIVDEQMKAKELENKLKNQRKFDDKKQKLLERLFDFYNTMNKLLNTNTATNKAPPKEILSDIINLKDPEEFQASLDQIEGKLRQFIDDFKYKFGKCFACDIACCTSEVDRKKYFRNYYPGPPKK